MERVALLMNVQTIGLREIRVFLTLAEELHFGPTAERLGLTQSRVSQTLRALERRLGDRLVDRTSRSLGVIPEAVQESCVGKSPCSRMNVRHQRHPDPGRSVGVAWGRAASSPIRARSYATTSGAGRPQRRQRGRRR